jgi:5-methylcytosine-specific restriction endonuclease McrA
MDGQRDFVLGAPRVQRSSCVALRPGRYKLQLTASQALHDKLEQLQHLLRHQVPGGELATIVERAVDLLLATTLNRRFAQKHAERAPQASTSVERAEPAGRVTSRERATPVEPAGTSKAVAASKDRRKTQSRYVPRAVVREVYARDEGQCTFVSSNARRCSERGALELHHVIPFGLGGPTTVDNLRIVCRAHNALFAERDFGADHIRLKRSQHHSTQQTITHTRL